MLANGLHALNFKETKNKNVEMLGQKLANHIK